MATLKLRKTHIAVVPGHREYQTCRTIFGGTYLKEYKEFRFPYGCLIYVLAHFYQITNERDLVKAVQEGKVAPKLLEIYQREKQQEARTAELKKLGPQELWNKGFLYSHQQLCREIADINPRYGFFCEAGTGKTPMTLQIIWDDINRGRSTGARRRWIVVCPLSLIKPAWMNDCKKFFPHMKIVNLHGNTPKQTELAFNTQADVYVINYESFKNKYDRIVEMKFDGLIVDESSKMKNHSSQITEHLTEYAAHVERAYLLSGTPAPNSMLEYFPQLKAIDASILGSNFTNFKSVYFYQINKGGFESFQIMPDKQEALTKQLERRCVFIAKQDCLDLPEKMPAIIRQVPMSPDVKKHYKLMKKELYTILKDKTVVSATTAVTMLGKLNQLTSGILLDNGQVHKISDVKVNELLDVLEDIGNKQVIIWAHYRGEFDILRDVFKDRCVTYNGETSKAEVKPLVDKHYGPGSFDAFYEEGHSIKDMAAMLFAEGKVQYFIANNQSAGHGLTFTNCSYAVFFSLDYSYERWSQSQDRIHRIGQTSHCNYIYLLMENSIDYTIYNVLTKKGDISQAVLNHLKAASLGGTEDED